MIIKIFQEITHIKLLNIEFYATPHFTLTSNQDVKKDNFSHPLFQKAIGAMRFSQLNAPFDYAFSIQERTEKYSRPELAPILADAMDKVQQFANGLAMFLWFIKDNSVNVTDVFGHLEDENLHSFLGMSPTSFVTNCHGEFQEVSFARNEVDRAYALSRLYTSICPQNEEELNDRMKLEMFSNKFNVIFKKGENDDINYNSFNRIERAIKFLQVTRETSYLPRKISLYMPIFECLFSTESEGVTHKVSERLAFYLGGDKKNTFNTIKEAYNIRSRYLHGDEMIKNQSKKSYQLDLVSKIDDITRRTLTKIITEDSKKFLLSKDEFRAYLSNIIFD